ncbi:VOC family protein [Streptomyces sp. NPDC002159]
MSSVRIEPRLLQHHKECPTRSYTPARTAWVGSHTPGALDPAPVQPRRLGHVVGSSDLQATTRFFTDGLGFRTSDHVKGHGAFMRCSTDHHNVLVLSSPMNFLHHTTWLVDNVNEVGRGAGALLHGQPERRSSAVAERAEQAPPRPGRHPRGEMTLRSHPCGPSRANCCAIGPSRADALAAVTSVGGRW